MSPILAQADAGFRAPHDHRNPPNSQLLHQSAQPNRAAAAAMRKPRLIAARTGSSWLGTWMCLRERDECRVSGAQEKPRFFLRASDRGRRPRIRLQHH